MWVWLTIASVSLQRSRNSPLFGRPLFYPLEALLAARRCASTRRAGAEEEERGVCAREAGLLFVWIPFFASIFVYANPKSARLLLLFELLPCWLLGRSWASLGARAWLSES